MGLFAFNAMRKRAEAEKLKKTVPVKTEESAEIIKEEPVPAADTATEPVTAAVEKKKSKKAATVEKKEA